MQEAMIAVATACRDGAESGAMTFPQIVAALAGAGIESYAVDFRRQTITYFAQDGDSLELATHRVETAIAPRFDVAAMQAAIREAQTLAPGYTYRGFCQKAAAAGCAGYVVSLMGRRAVYFGRTAETHAEHFPD